MSSALLLEDGSYLLLEDGSSRLLLETAIPVGKAGHGPITSYLVEAAWGQFVGEMFTFGVSQFGSSTDLLGAASWSGTFNVPYGDLTARTRQITIQRGRDDYLSNMQAGQCTISGVDPDGLLNERNASSPLHGLLYSGVPVRVSAMSQSGLKVPLYYGLIDTLTSDPGGRRGSFQIQCTDFFSRLDRENPNLGSLSGQTTGSLFGLILNYFGWIEPSLRSLGVGDVLPSPYTRADGSRSALSIVEEALEAERGYFFVAADGTVTYLSRYDVLLNPPAAALNYVITGAPVALDRGRVRNRWTVGRTDMAGNAIGVPQVAAVDTGSQSFNRYHWIDDSIDSAYLVNDNQALALSQYLLSLTQSPDSIAWQVPISPADGATLDEMVFRDLGDRVTLTVAPDSGGWPGYTSDYVIEQITHNIATGTVPRHTTSWGVRTAPATNPFRFGVSTMGGSDVLVY